jgi:hypothetical protein
MQNLVKKKWNFIENSEEQKKKLACFFKLIPLHCWVLHHVGVIFLRSHHLNKSHAEERKNSAQLEGDRYKSRKNLAVLSKKEKQHIKSGTVAMIPGVNSGWIRRAAHMTGNVGCHPQEYRGGTSSSGSGGSLPPRGCSSPLRPTSGGRMHPQHLLVRGSQRCVTAFPNKWLQVEQGSQSKLCMHATLHARCDESVVQAMGSIVVYSICFNCTRSA